MTFALDPEVAVVLEQAGPMPAPPPAGDVEARRGALNGMLEHFNNVAQPIASDVDTIDYDIPGGCLRRADLVGRPRRGARSRPEPHRGDG
jgi:hypothetical protein